MNNMLPGLEEMAINAFPALQTELYGGWLLRFSEGYTNRGNCVNPLYSSPGNIETGIGYCEERYFSRGLPCVFKLTDDSPPELDALLTSFGYERTDGAMVMTAPLSAPDREYPGIVIGEKVTARWLDIFLSLKGVGKTVTARAARAMIGNISLPVYCAVLRRDGKAAGCGLGVLERGWLGLFDLYVEPEFRRQGLGGALCRSIMNAGFRDGAENAYLQVAVGNEGAIQLYQQQGFSRCYDYWYRKKRHPDIIIEPKDPAWTK